MKQSINEIKRMQELAGIINESQLNEEKYSAWWTKANNELGLDFEKLATDDRKSARDMQAATKSSIPAILAVFVTTGFFGILTALMMGYAQKSDELMIMLGSLGTAWTGIIGFYFGSSAGSQEKDKMLHQSTPIK